MAATNLVDELMEVVKDSKFGGGKIGGTSAREDARRTRDLRMYTRSIRYNNTMPLDSAIWIMEDGWQR